MIDTSTTSFLIAKALAYLVGVPLAIYLGYKLAEWRHYR